MPTFQLLYNSLSLLKKMSSLIATSVMLYDWAVQPQLLAWICPAEHLEQTRVPAVDHRKEVNPQVEILSAFIACS